ncbi:hypothetical protein [Amycolatopsis sp. CA-230715]|uniref:hypothetical protein n=1 Tax=Amycolatopsis sp. CA-230715 TaxID=2745196 RepID=UPI001C02B7CC|nr:hypothetical protein [Amycolatopsis sp. CA-230715]
MTEDYLGVNRRRFPSADMLRSAAALTPALSPQVRAGRTWAEVHAAAVDGQQLLPGHEWFELLQAQQLTEGPQWMLSISPGRVRVWTRDEARVDRRELRERDMRLKAADALATFLEENDEGELEDHTPDDPTPTREVTSWSAKSRVNMIASYLDLDYTAMFADASRLPAMLTLTYPRCWQTVAPNGKAVKAHMKAWRKRWEREFGETLNCIWKLEFQGRREWVLVDGDRRYNWCTCDECAPSEDGRAPHVHMLVTIPTTRVVHDARGRVRRDEQGRELREPISRGEFQAWLSTSWADVVEHPNPAEYAAHLAAGTRVDVNEGRKAADPRRVATYFAKHGGAKAKEYQHIVPKRWQEPGEGPGRFWGYWGIAKRVVSVAVDPALGAEAGRLVRRYSRAQGVTRETVRRRYRGGRADSKYGEIIGLAGKQLLAAHRVTYRPCRTRAVRARDGRGWVAVNDGANMAAHLGHALVAAIEHRQADRLPSPPRDPLARAFRLPAGPRRDALLARLQQRNQ